MDSAQLEHSTELLDSLRVIARRYRAIEERKVFGCPSFFIERRMTACVYGNQIELRLPQLAVTALLQTPGCTFFQPFGRYPMKRWLAIESGSPAFASLDDLFEEAVLFARE